MLGRLLVKRELSSLVRRFLLICVLLCGALPGVAWSRNWKPDSTALARDYSIITDSRDNQDVKMIFWITSHIVPLGVDVRFLDDYVVIGVARGHVSPTATLAFDDVDTLQVLDGESKPLKLLRGDDIPPAISGTVATLTRVFAQSMGAFGQGFHWFVFEAGSVHACGPGGLSIPFADEVYTYTTPIPGCPGQ